MHIVSANCAWKVSCFLSRTKLIVSTTNNVVELMSGVILPYDGHCQFVDGGRQEVVGPWLSFLRVLCEMLPQQVRQKINRTSIIVELES